MTVLRTILDLVLLWLAADLLHHLWVRTRMARWERTLTRDAQGLRAGVLPYTAGRGPVALLWIHGFADSPAVFRRMTERLAGTGRFTCRAMRLPGAGETVRQAARVTRDDWQEAVRREIAELRREHAQVWLVGHSLGAALALHAALEPANQVAGVVALAPLLRVSRRRSPLLPPSAWFGLARTVFFFSRTFESCFAPDTAAADDPGFHDTRDRFIPFATYRNLFALIEELAPRAADLRVPVFAALAAEDRVVDTAAAQRWLDGVPAPTSIRVLPGVAHELPLECGWQQLTDDFSAFIAEPRRAPLSGNSPASAPARV